MILIRLDSGSELFNTPEQKAAIVSRIRGELVPGEKRRYELYEAGKAALCRCGHISYDHPGGALMHLGATWACAKCECADYEDATPPPPRVVGELEVSL